MDHIWNGVAKQLQKIAEDLAFACEVPSTNIKLATIWNNSNIHSPWTMKWIATVETGNGTYSGIANTPVEACRKARNVWGHSGEMSKGKKMPRIWTLSEQNKVCDIGAHFRADGVCTNLPDFFIEEKLLEAMIFDHGPEDA